jgi:hypothetical protein
MREPDSTGRQVLQQMPGKSPGFLVRIPVSNPGTHSTCIRTPVTTTAPAFCSTGCPHVFPVRGRYMPCMWQPDSTGRQVLQQVPGKSSGYGDIPAGPKPGTTGTVIRTSPAATLRFSTCSLRPGTPIRNPYLQGVREPDKTRGQILQ